MGGEGDDKMVGWHYQLNGHGSWWWTGRPGVLQSMGSQRVRHDWATELHWTIGAELSGPTSPHSVGKPWETSSKLTAANGPGKGRSLEHGRIVEHGHSSSKQEGTSLAVQWLRLHFHCSSCGFHPWSGILHASGQQKRGKKKKTTRSVTEFRKPIWAWRTQPLANEKVKYCGNF